MTLAHLLKELHKCSELVCFLLPKLTPTAALLGEKYLPALSEVLVLPFNQGREKIVFVKNKQTQVFQSFMCSPACAVLKGTQVIMVGKYMDGPSGVQIHT